MRSIAFGLSLLAMSGCAATGEAPPKEIRLANCPTPVRILLPALFSNGTDASQQIGRADLERMVGPIAMAVTSRERPLLLLLVTENLGIVDRQGKITPNEFAAMKAAMNARNSEVARLETNKLVKPRGGSLEKSEILATESGEDWSAAILQLEGTAEGSNFQSLLAGRINYVSHCVVDVLVFSPTTDATVDELLGMLREVAVE